MAEFFKNTNPTSADNVSAGYPLGSFWNNMVSYDVYEHVADGEWYWRKQDGTLVNIEIPEQLNKTSPIPELDLMITGLTNRVEVLEDNFESVVLESIYSYGVLIDNRFSSPIVTRIGNLEMHKTLPIHTKMKGCLLLDDGTVNYYLNPTNWAQKADTTTSNLTGADGQVMVEIPQYYVKYKTIDQNQIEIRISEQPLTGYILKPKRYISAYKASLQRSNSKLSSVINLTADFRGGNNNAAWDAAANSFLGKPVTEVSLANFRTYARNRGNGNRWNCMTYDLRKSMYWLFVIEYANLNSQAAVAAKDAVTGYMQGGLGSGVTTANGTEWNTFNGYRPFIPCGASNSLGNGSGEVSYVATNFAGAGVNRTFTVNRYRGIENPFGDIWEWTDGVLIDVKTVASGGTSTLYTSSYPAQFTSSVLANYTQRGLISRTDGYVRQMLFGVDGDILPINNTGGGSTIYYCDNFWRDINSDAIRGVIFGGGAVDGSYAGLVYAGTANAPSNAGTNIGSRLCFV